jgi:hypothetical protein
MYKKEYCNVNDTDKKWRQQNTSSDASVQKYDQVA